MKWLVYILQKDYELLNDVEDDKEEIDAAEDLDAEPIKKDDVSCVVINIVVNYCQVP